MLTKVELIRAYDKGWLEDVVKECRKYGTISKDKTWDEDSGYYAGCHRVFTVTHHDIDWSVHMWNGEVWQLGHTHATALKAV